MADNNQQDTNLEQDVAETADKAEESSEKELSEQEKIENELEDKNNQLLRLAAEYDNFRKRSQKERECAYNDAKSMVLSELLPILDNIDRAKEISDITSEDYKKGIDMTFKQIDEIFEKMEVESFGEPKEQFDPNIHNAVMHIDDENYGENEITDVFVKGYKMGDKVLRPAMVKVAN